jgi:hypothetical protein
VANRIICLPRCSNHVTVKDFSFDIGMVTEAFSLTLQLGKLQCVSPVVFVCYFNVGESDN